MRWIIGLILAFGWMAVAKAEVIDQVWAGHPVGFAIAASDTQLYVGYYDAERRLTVAQRPLSGGAWNRQVLDTAVVWDSHNYIALAIDSDDRLHVAANMHVSPLTYYLSDISGSVASLKRQPVLVDTLREQRMTYPVFLTDTEGRLIFKYRDGGSGNGNDIYNVFDGTWRPLLTTPLTDGEGQRNAYPVGPVEGSDGAFHLTWVWRETPDAATNHDLSYAKSRDLIHWQKADGTPTRLPMTFESAEIVDPVPVNGGMINNNTLIGFDAQKRPLIAYHKYDDAGHTQIYLARFDGSRWQVVQASDWQDYRWDFGGNGSLVFEVTLQPPFQSGEDVIVPVTRLAKTSELHVRASDLTHIAETPAPLSPFAGEVAGVTVPEGMVLNQQAVNASGRNYLLVWATLPQNRDLPRDTVPPASSLYLFEK